VKANDPSELAIENARRMRQRLLQGMLGLVRSQALTGPQTAAAKDMSEHVERTLALMVVEALWSWNTVVEYARRAGLPLPPSDRNPAESLIALRAAAARRVGSAIAAEAWLQEQMKAARDHCGGIPPPDEAPNLTANDVKSALSEYLRTRLKEPALEVTAAEAIPGGRSKQTFSLTISGSRAIQPRCVLRVDRKVSLVPTRAFEEFELLRVLWEFGGVAVPPPLLAESGDEVLGGSFTLSGFVGGSKAGEYFPEVYGLPEDAKSICRELARILGRLHGIDLQTFPVTLRSLESRHELSEQIDSAYRQGRAAGLQAAEFEAAHQWLQAHLSSATAPARLCHGDLGLHNLLVENGRITALLDWELATGMPGAYDLASIRHLIEHVMPWRLFVEEYLKAGGCPDSTSPATLDFYTVFRRFRINVASHTAASMYREGSSNDFVLANAGYDMAVRGRQLLIEIMDRLTT
jgi:aminoglycoside phosphotransferase (APT) family kinase protein